MLHGRPQRGSAIPAKKLFAFDLIVLAPRSGSRYNFFKMNKPSDKTIARLSNELVAASAAIWETSPGSKAETNARAKSAAAERRLFSAERRYHLR